MTKIKEIIKKRKKGITLEEEVKPIVKSIAVLTRTIQAPPPSRVPLISFPAKPSKKPRPPPSPLQVLSTRYNWDTMQIKGAFGHIESIRQKLQGAYAFQYTYENGLAVIRTEMLKAVKAKWEADKRAYLLKVEQEAFAMYPRSFRGSPAEINKRLDILKAQEEF